MNGVKSGTGCVAKGTQVELFNSGTVAIEKIPVLWQSNIDLETGRFLEPDDPNSSELRPLEILEHYHNIALPLTSLDGTEVFPIFRVEGTLKEPHPQSKEPKLIRLYFGEDFYLEATEDHPIMTQGNTITSADQLKFGNTITTPFEVREFASWEDIAWGERSKDQSRSVYNLGLGSREVLDLLRVSLIALSKAL